MTVKINDYQHILLDGEGMDWIDLAQDRVGGRLF
jgi:hypothetical protein